MRHRHATTPNGSIRYWAWTVIAEHLASTGSNLSVTAIASELGVSRVTVSRAIDALEAEGRLIVWRSRRGNTYLPVWERRP